MIGTNFFRIRLIIWGIVLTSPGCVQPKVAAIIKAPTPKNVHELQAFLGLINNYGKFISKLSTVAHPLHHLRNKMLPGIGIQNVMSHLRNSKHKASMQVLAHYDQSLTVKLDYDASAYGVGTFLAHVYPNETERPIANTSRSLSPAKLKYARIEKVGLLLNFGMKKFHEYLYDQRFTLVTDHKPLMAILAAQLQRWAIFLLGYQYDLEFCITGQHTSADRFSHLPLSDVLATDVEPSKNATLFKVQQIDSLSLWPKK